MIQIVCQYHAIFPHKVYIFLIKINISFQWKCVQIDVDLEQHKNAQTYNSVQLQFRSHYSKYKRNIH